VSPDALSPADALANVLQEHERETKLSLARSARRMAKDAEEATLREAPYVHKAAQVASITHGWREKEKNPNTILNLGVLIGSEGPTRAILPANPESEGPRQRGLKENDSKGKNDPLLFTRSNHLQSADAITGGSVH
jgi:hypothetical protein